MAHRRLGIIEFLWIIKVPPDPPSQTDSPSAPNSQDTQDPPNQSDSQTPYLIVVNFGTPTDPRDQTGPSSPQNPLDP